VSPQFGYYFVHTWAGEADMFEPVEQMFASVGGELVAHPVTAGDRTDPVIEAFLDERLWLWQVPVIGVDAPAVFPALPGQPQKPGKELPEQLTWIEIKLVDHENRPVANERYLLVLADGQRRNGHLDENGFARVDRIPGGICDVTFPDIDGREWGRKE